jgi:HK97 family phage portal protein
LAFVHSYTTESGLVVSDRRHARSDPRSWPPNEGGAGVNEPPSTVGPTSSEGVGNDHVMYPAIMPPPVQAWSGWPVEWNTPTWGGSIGPLGGIINRVSTVFGAIDLNSSILSTMPPYRLQGDDVVDPLPWMSNPQPEVYTGWTEAMKQIVTGYFGNGEVFLWATNRYADRSVRNWVMLNPSWVDVDMIGQIRQYSMLGMNITEDVLHLRYSSWPGEPHGVGPMSALAYTLFGVAAMERYQANLAMRGGIPWGVLTAPGNLSENQAALLRDNWVAARASAMGAPATLSGGVTLTQFSISPRDMALLELRQFDEARIATLLCVPPMLLGLPTGDSSMTYRNAEGIYDFHWRAYLRPKAATIMEGISNWALPSTQRVEVNRDEYVRPAFNERVAGYQILFNILDPNTGQRAISIDEIRAAERLNALDDVEDTALTQAEDTVTPPDAPVPPPQPAVPATMP